MNTTTNALQLTEPFQLKDDALDALECLRVQQGFLGGRVLAPRTGATEYTLQAFFRDEGLGGEWLPDGMRRVVILDGQRGTLGLPC